jgi:hypothetical protein
VSSLRLLHLLHSYFMLRGWCRNDAVDVSVGQNVPAACLLACPVPSTCPCCASCWQVAVQRRLLAQLQGGWIRPVWLCDQGLALGPRERPLAGRCCNQHLSPKTLLTTSRASGRACNNGQPAHATAWQTRASVLLAAQRFVPRGHHGGGGAGCAPPLAMMFYSCDG